MRRLAAVVARAPVAALLLLAVPLGWWPWLVFGAGSFGPGVSLAALAVVALIEGRRGVGALLGQLTRWRVGWRWYAVAVGLPVAATLLAVALNERLGAPPPTAEQLAGWPSAVLLFPLYFALFGAAEELGWRGYVLPRFQRRHGALVATVQLAALSALWHAPLFLTGSIPWSDLAFLLTGYVVLTWLYNSTGGSVLLVMLSHATLNAVSGEFFLPMFAGADAERYGWLLAALYGAVALGVLVRTGPARLSGCRVGHRVSRAAARAGGRPRGQPVGEPRRRVEQAPNAEPG
jgi:membrane protease YdiL (CAAX protease family)